MKFFDIKEVLYIGVRISAFVHMIR